uniref:Secreted protein n=1 Tax=Ascaris lumbricoides TaxID=6252 RepID=A0A0M3IW18_ASCLU
MIHSSRFLAIYVLLAALIYVHALECYDYYIQRGANGYSQKSTRPVKCPKSEYCIQLFGMLRTGPNSLRYVREQTCEKSKYVSGAVCKFSSGGRKPPKQLPLTALFEIQSYRAVIVG